MLSFFGRGRWRHIVGGSLLLVFPGAQTGSSSVGMWTHGGVLSQRADPESWRPQCGLVITFLQPSPRGRPSYAPGLCPPPPTPVYWFPVFTSPPALDLSPALPNPPPSRHSLPHKDTLCSRFPVHTGILTPVTYPCTGYQLLFICPLCDPKGCFLSVLWLFSQTGPADQWAALLAHEFNYLSPRRSESPALERIEVVLSLSLLDYSPLVPDRFLFLFSFILFFIACSYSFIIISQFFISNFLV